MQPFYDNSHHVGHSTIFIKPQILKVLYSHKEKYVSYISVEMLHDYDG
jgi:hypothetical protein